MDHGEVDALLCQQLLVRALLLHPAVLNHHDQVCVLDGGQAVRDHNAGAPFPGFVQRFLDDLSKAQQELRTENFSNKCDDYLKLYRLSSINHRDPFF